MDIDFLYSNLPVDWGNRIRRLHLCGLDPPTEYPASDIKPSDGEAPVLEFGVLLHC